MTVRTTHDCSAWKKRSHVCDGWEMEIFDLPTGTYFSISKKLISAVALLFAAGGATVTGELSSWYEDVLSISIRRFLNTASMSSKNSQFTCCECCFLLKFLLYVMSMLCHFFDTFSGVKSYPNERIRRHMSTHSWLLRAPPCSNSDSRSPRSLISVLVASVVQ